MTYIPAHKLVSFAKITIDATASLYTNMAAAIFIFLSVLKARSRYKAKTIVLPVRCWSGKESTVSRKMNDFNDNVLCVRDFSYYLQLVVVIMKTDQGQLEKNGTRI